jgi:hypothetical protein
MAGVCGDNPSTQIQWVNIPEVIPGLHPLFPVTDSIESQGKRHHLMLFCGDGIVG